MKQVVVGLFEDFSEARRVVEELTQRGFRRENINIIANRDKAEKRSSEGVISESDLSGAETGAVVGGVAGFALGLAALLIPGIGPVIAAGPIATALGGAAVGAVAGGLIGALTDLGIPEEDAQGYAEGVRRGGSLVTVESDDARVDEARSIIARHHPTDIRTRREEWARAEEPSTRAESPRRPSPSSQQRQSTNEPERAIPVVEERLSVGKREVDSGGVRVYQRTTERPVEAQVQLRQERVHVDRRPADRPATPRDQRAFQEGEIRIEETSEEPVVAKQSRVVEEVVVGKDVSQRTETIRDTVKKSDVSVEKTPSRRRGAKATAPQRPTDEGIRPGTHH